MKKESIIVGLLLLSNVAVHAQILQFDAYGKAGPTYSSTANSSLVTSSTLSEGSGLSFPGDIPNTVQFDYATAGGVPKSFAQSVLQNDDLLFTITPTSGPISITSISLQGYTEGSLATEFVLTNALGVQLAPALNVTGPAFTLSSNGVLTATLTTPLTIASATQLRLYTYNNTNPGSDNIYNERGLGVVGNIGSDLSVYGSAAPLVPEPTTYVLLGMGMLGLIVVAKRRNATVVS